MSKLFKRRNAPKTFQSHLIEDELEKILLGIRSKLNVADQLAQFPDQNSSAVKQQLQIIRSEVSRDLQILLKSGYSLTDAISKMDQLIFRKDLIEASEKVKEIEEKGQSHRVVDLFNEDKMLQERASHYKIQDDDWESIYQTAFGFSPSNNFVQTLQDDFDDYDDDLPDVDIVQGESSIIQEEPKLTTNQEETKQTPAGVEEFKPSPKVLGNEQVRRIEKDLIEGRDQQAKNKINKLLQDYIAKKQKKEYTTDVNPKSQKMITILQRLYPDVQYVNVSAEKIAQQILQTS